MFNTKIPLYGIIISLSIIIGLIVVYFYSKKEKFTRDELISFLLFVLLGAIYGAKYFTYIFNRSRYNGDFDFLKIGLTSSGALIGIVLMIFIYSKLFKKSFRDLLYIITPPIPLMYGISKLACFFAGCCHGIEYDGPLSITYNYSVSAPIGKSLFPVQIVETIIFILIFIFINNKIKKEKNKNKIIGITFFLCGLAKFLLDYLRMSHIGIIFSPNQIVCLIFIVGGIYLLIKKEK